MNWTTISEMDAVTGVLGISIASVAHRFKRRRRWAGPAQQNKIGGVAKPAPVIGGAAIHTPPPPTPPKPVVNFAKPASPGVTPTANTAALGQVSYINGFVSVLRSACLFRLSRSSARWPSSVPQPQSL